MNNNKNNKLNNLNKYNNKYNKNKYNNSKYNSKSQSNNSNKNNKNNHSNNKNNNNHKNNKLQHHQTISMIIAVIYNKIKTKKKILQFNKHKIKKKQTQVIYLAMDSIQVQEDKIIQLNKIINKIIVLSILIFD